MKPTARLNKFLPLLLVALLLTAVAPRKATLGYDYKKGSTWKYETLFAPFDFPILKTAEQMQEEMDKVADNYIPYFKYSAGVTESALAAASAMDLDTLKPTVLEAVKSIMDHIGAFFSPAKTKKRNTSAAVGIALIAIIVGLKTYFNFVKLPTITPNKIAATVPIKKPYNILLKEPHIHLYV